MHRLYCTGVSAPGAYGTSQVSAVIPAIVLIPRRPSSALQVVQSCVSRARTSAGPRERGNTGILPVAATVMNQSYDTSINDKELPAAILHKHHNDGESAMLMPCPWLTLKP